MNRAAARELEDDGPDVIRFKARLLALPAGGDTLTLEFPKAVGRKMGEMTRVEGVINGHPFRAALESAASGRRWLRVNQAMRKGARAGAGDTVDVAVLGPEPEPVVSADLRAAFKTSQEARALWKDLPTECRRDYIRWIDATKNPDTRARRITRTVEQLADGKRRPCCVNFYDYMLRRVRE
jgi:hypothetical protein